MGKGPQSRPHTSQSCLSSQLNVADLQKELDKSQSMFPENPSVWVKDLAGCLNYKLQAPKSDPTLSQHAHGQCCNGGRLLGLCVLRGFSVVLQEYSIELNCC